MKKIIRIIARLNIGGPAIHTILLSSALNKGGYNDILICGKESEFEGNMGYLARRKNVKPILVPELKREISFKSDMKAFFKLYSIIKEEKPDILHTHTAKAGALGRLAGLCAGVPIKVHTFHGHVFDGYFSPVKAKLFLLIERLLALFTDKVIAVSESVKDDIVMKLKVAGEGKCAVIPLGLDLGKFSDCEKEKNGFKRRFGLRDATLLVGIVGRLVPIKNHRMFLDIAKKVRTDNPACDVKFVVIGDGELRDALKSYAGEIGLKEDVLFTGWVEDLRSVYADLDIVALTSLNEGTPVSLIEAMAAGKAVIATDVGGVKDLVKPDVNGLLVGQKDINGFAEKMLSLLGDAKRRKDLGIRARDSVMKAYSEERLVMDMKSLYKDLLAKKRICCDGYAEDL